MKLEHKLIIVMIITAISIIFFPSIANYIVGGTILISIGMALLPYLLATLKLFHLDWVPFVIAPLFLLGIVASGEKSISDYNLRIAYLLIVIIICIIILYYLGKSILKDLFNKP